MAHGDNRDLSQDNLLLQDALIPEDMEMNICRGQCSSSTTPVNLGSFESEEAQEANHICMLRVSRGAPLPYGSSAVGFSPHLISGLGYHRCQRQKSSNFLIRFRIE